MPGELKETTLRFSFLTISSRLIKLACAGAALVTCTMLMGQDTQTAIANGDTRTINLYHTHRKDSISITFKRGGYYDKAALSKLNYFLRDWRNNKQTNMDPRLFDVVWEAYTEAGHRGAIHVVSAYRSPETNAMLRRRSRGVAKHSQHTMGKAMDTTVPGLGMARVREVGMRLQMGGVGFYPRSRSPFVHLDVGNVRAWPRMTYAQLQRVFPDGRTVHQASDGRRLPGYQLALADIRRYGRGVGGAEGEDGGGDRGFFEALFGGGTDEGENYSDPSDNSPLAIAQRDARRSNNPTQVASVEPIKVPSPAPKAKARPVVVDERPVAAEPDALVAPATLTPTPTPRPRTPAAETQIALGEPQTLQPRIESRLDADNADELVKVPLPPRRPANLDKLVAVASADALVDVPLPPRRPASQTALALAEDPALADAAPDAAPGIDTSGVTPELGPVAVLRPSTTASTPRPLDEPKLAVSMKDDEKLTPPPLRVSSLAAPDQEAPLTRSFRENERKAAEQSLPELIREGRGKPGSDEDTLANLALVDVPLPPRRPASLKGSNKTAEAPVVVASADPEAAEIEAPAKALKIRPSTKSLAAPPKSVVLPKAKPKTASVIATGFTKNKQAPEAGSFSGAMLRPLGAKFVKKPIEE
jgi:uncharacterized protein YcbK (DUF882 family)